MKICMLQSYSKNNQKLFNLTIGNHIKYCNLHEYSFLTINESYTPFINFKKIYNLLKIYDIIFTIGSDVVITNLDKKIEDFINFNYSINICKEGQVTTLVNGEIIIFIKNNKIFNILDYLDLYQLKNNTIYQGTQGIFNKLFFEKDKITNDIYLIEAGILQKYIYFETELTARKHLTYNLLHNKQYEQIIKKQLNIDSCWLEYIKDFDELIWKDKNDFCAHALGTHTNDEKFNLCLNIIKNDPSLIIL